MHAYEHGCSFCHVHMHRLQCVCTCVGSEARYWRVPTSRVLALYTRAYSSGCVWLPPPSWVGAGDKARLARAPGALEALGARATVGGPRALEALGAGAPARAPVAEEPPPARAPGALGAGAPVGGPGALEARGWERAPARARHFRTASWTFLTDSGKTWCHVGWRMPIRSFHSDSCC